VTTPAQDAPLVFPSVAFRPLRLLVISAALTAAAMVLAGLAGQLAFGVFFGVGLALGLVNALLVRRSVSSITAEDHPLKAKMALNSATRLLVITVAALAIAAFYARHGGLGVVVGLAVFQVILILATMMPVVKKLRRQGSQPGLAGDRAGGTAGDD
jgi:dipeptide/tripeptide permease